MATGEHMTPDIRTFGVDLFGRWTSMWNGELPLAPRIMADKLTLRYAQAGAEPFDDAHTPAAMAEMIRRWHANRPGIRFATDGEAVVDLEWQEGAPAGMVECPCRAWFVDTVGQTNEHRWIDVLRVRGGRIVEVVRRKQGGAFLLAWLSVRPTSAPPPLPFFSSPSVRASEDSLYLRITAGRTVALVVSPWRLLEAEPVDDRCVLRGAFADLGDDPAVRVIGPFERGDAAALARAICSRYALPRRIERVSYEALEATPRAFHMRHVEAEGIWTYGFEASHFAGAWLTASAAVCAEVLGDHRHRSVRVRARGIFRCERDGGGYGHLGGSPAGFDAYEVEIL